MTLVFSYLNFYYFLGGVLKKIPGGRDKRMELKEDQASIKDLFKDTITLLCKNGLQYNAGFSGIS